MTFSDKLIALRKKGGLVAGGAGRAAERQPPVGLKWESAQSMPDIDKILQLSSLFSVTTDCLFKNDADDTQPAAADALSLPRVTLAQANDYLARPGPMRRSWRWRRRSVSSPPSRCWRWGR